MCFKQPTPHSQGPAVPKFEHAVAKVGAKYGVAGSATSALHIACLALGLGPGDTLWTSPTTFVASANCGRYCGAKIDFVDIDQQTGLMSVNSLRETSNCRKEKTLPKVVIPVHLCGTSCDMTSIAELADQYGFFIYWKTQVMPLADRTKGKMSDVAITALLRFSAFTLSRSSQQEKGLSTTNDPTKPDA